MDFSKIQNPKVRQYLEEKYRKQGELDEAKGDAQFYGGIADAAASLGTAMVNSNPSVMYKNRFSDMGKPPQRADRYQGKVDASPVKAMLNNKVSDAQGALTKVGQDFDEEIKLDSYMSNAANSAEESDPTSEISRQYQDLAKKFMPNGSYEKVSAAKLKQLMPPLEKAYQFDMQKTQRAEDLAERRQDRQTQYAIAQGNRADQKMVQQEEKLNQEVQKVSDTLGSNQAAISAIQQVEAELGAPLDAFTVEGNTLKKGGQAVDLPGVNIPLIGRVTAHDSKAQNLQSAADRIFNVTLKDRSGAAVTTPEMDRLKAEFLSGRFNSEAQLIKGLQDYKKAAAEAIRAQEAGYRPEAVQRYEERGGRTSRALNTSPSSSTSGRVMTADQLPD
jgi:hypothetical protein